MRTPRLEGAEADVHWSLFLRGGREVGMRRCVHVFLSVEWCLPFDGASGFELLQCSRFRVAHSVAVLFFFSEEV